MVEDVLGAGRRQQRGNRLVPPWNRRRIRSSGSAYRTPAGELSTACHSARPSANRMWPNSVPGPHVSSKSPYGPSTGRSVTARSTVEPLWTGPG